MPGREIDLVVERLDANAPRRRPDPHFPARDDPVDAWERERVRRIEHLQGNTNPFVQ